MSREGISSNPAVLFSISLCQTAFFKETSTVLWTILINIYKNSDFLNSREAFPYEQRALCLITTRKLSRDQKIDGDGGGGASKGNSLLPEDSTEEDRQM